MKALPLWLLALSVVGGAESIPAAPASGSRVRFNSEGIALVDEKPFFPIGLFIYELNSDVLAELAELQCNTILHGFATNQLDLLQQRGLMAVCSADPTWIQAARNHPALLAWYLADEPEGRVPPETSRKQYLELKRADTNHPIGLCHTSFEALTQFKQACDFTMTDIYPITMKRDQNVLGVSIMMDEARRIHGSNWPQWTYIQVFGGPETDNGVWTVPLPHEVRLMAYQALVHRANGILYFSYWPRQPRTWQSVAALNREIQQLVPRLVAPGKESTAKVNTTHVQVRARIGDSRSGLVIALNTSPRFVQTYIELGQAPAELTLPFEGRVVQPSSKGIWAERFGPYAAHVYVWGPEPRVQLARESAGRK
jgi:hypothetical protein